MKTQSDTTQYYCSEVSNCIYSLMYIMDNTNTTMVWCNENMVNETGYTLREMKNMGIEFFRTAMHPDDFIIARKIQEEFSKGLRKRAAGFCRFRDKNTPVWQTFFGTATPFSYTVQGEVKEVCCLLQLFPPALDTPEQAKATFQVFSNEYNRSILETLTEREARVLHLLKQGSSTPEIAKELLLGYETVRKCLAGLREKFNVHTLQALAAMANELGL